MKIAGRIKNGTLGEAVEDYLKAIHQLSLRSDRVTPSAVAERLEISSAAVTKMVKRLLELELIEYSRSQGLRLSREGERNAARVLRTHRLMELFLARELDLPWEEVHREAERLEHVISARVEERIDAALGHPTHDPHGHPIPRRDGRIEKAELTPLAQLEPGERASVSRVADSDPDMLRYIGELGLFPGTPVEMLEPEPFGGSLRIRISGIELPVGRELAANVFIIREAELICEDS